MALRSLNCWCCRKCWSRTCPRVCLIGGGVFGLLRKTVPTDELVSGRGDCTDACNRREILRNTGQSTPYGLIRFAKHTWTCALCTEPNFALGRPLARSGRDHTQRCHSIFRCRSSHQASAGWFSLGPGLPRPATGFGSPCHGYHMAIGRIGHSSKRELDEAGLIILPKFSFMLLCAASYYVRCRPCQSGFNTGCTVYLVVPWY